MPKERTFLNPDKDQPRLFKSSQLRKNIGDMYNGSFKNEILAISGILKYVLSSCYQEFLSLKKELETIPTDTQKKKYTYHCKNLCYVDFTLFLRDK